ncbi:MAG TPA: metallopeptidase TldD-related protein, partial [Symbiobacteriaceae bacterium]|nr:metallopeptidase TldD-related protein [Symbiobacteriaceae bacterium]
QNLQRMIANTRGLDRTESANVAYFVVMAVVKDGEETKTAYRPKVVRALSDLDAAAMAREIVEEALSMLGAQPVESKTYPVLLRNTAAADLLETFAGIFHAANGQKGKSLLTRDKVGQPLASALVTIIDDPLMEGGMNCRSFDAEGVASRRLAVVEKGVLKSLLYNLKTALVDGVEPTGHGSRSSYKAALSTASTNLYIEPGTRSLHEMAESMGDGLVITDLQGLHSGANPISGDFSLAAHGYLVEGGRIGRPVNQITVAGNFYDVLKNIVEVGNDMDRRDGLPFLSPTLWIRGLAVAGK